MLRGTAKHSMARHGPALHCTALHGTALHGNARHGTARHLVPGGPVVEGRANVDDGSVARLLQGRKSSAAHVEGAQGVNL